MIRGKNQYFFTPHFTYQDSKNFAGNLIWSCLILNKYQIITVSYLRAAFYCSKYELASAPWSVEVSRRTPVEGGTIEAGGALGATQLLPNAGIHHINTYLGTGGRSLHLCDLHYIADLHTRSKNQTAFILFNLHSAT